MKFPINHQNAWVVRLTLALTIFAAAGCETTDHTTPFVNSGGIEFAEAADRAPTATTLFRVGKVLLAQEQHGRAETTFKNCIARYPRFLPAYEALADLYLRQQMIQAAGDVLREGLELTPESAILTNNLGMCELMLGNYEQALDAFKAAEVISSTDVRIRTNVAMATAHLRRYDEAFALYQELVSTGQAHYNIGVISGARDDQERSRQEFALARKNGVMRRP